MTQGGLSQLALGLNDITKCQKQLCVQKKQVKSLSGPTRRISPQATLVFVNLENVMREASEHLVCAVVVEGEDYFLFAVRQRDNLRLPQGKV